MNWEVILGLCTILTAFIAVFNIIIRVNKTLCSLEVVVKQIKECLDKQSEKQAEKNGIFFERLSDHEIRLTRLEDAIKEKGEKYE